MISRIERLFVPLPVRNDQISVRVRTNNLGKLIVLLAAHQTVCLHVNSVHFKRHKLLFNKLATLSDASHNFVPASRVFHNLHKTVVVVEASHETHVHVTHGQLFVAGQTIIRVVCLHYVFHR